MKPPTEQEIRTDELIASCQNSLRKDEICKAIVTVKNIGDDSVEAIKEFAHLGPYEYATLTVLNMIATKRLRLRSRSFLFHEAQHVYDIKSDQFTIEFEMKF